MGIETDRPAGFATRQLHAADGTAASRPRAVPIHLTAGFEFGSFESASEHFYGGVGYGYTRTGNPSAHAVERKLASLESGAEAILTASGQSSLAVTLLGLVPAGGHVVSSTHIYEGTRSLLLQNLAQAGAATSFVSDINDPEAWRALIRDETRALLAESISNALNRILDIRVVAQVAAEHGIPLIIDNTLATPFLLRPLEHGANIVIHSASKFLAGHGSVLGGVIVDDGRFDAGTRPDHLPRLGDAGPQGEAALWRSLGGRARIAYLRDVVAPRLGPTPSPLSAFLIGQGIETLSLRVREQTANALRVARWLQGHPGVQSVDHPSLSTHPDHDVAARYLPLGCGSVFTVTLKGGLAAARAVVDSVKVFTHMTHLGDVRSLILHPASTSHLQRSLSEREELGVYPGTLRLSIGIEDVDDLLADLDHALRAGARAADPDDQSRAPSPRDVEAWQNSPDTRAFLRPEPRSGERSEEGV